MPNEHGGAIAANDCGVNWPEVMTRTQAAQYLGVCVDWLNKHREVPRVRVAGTTRYLRSSLLDFLAMREVRS